ncbi:hypothetical protein FQA39_LY14298 [Lamprigera yunnana]|nr:hypothetical protein FQA39_LY14298 [Lamprigera yunnana]
MKLVLEKLDNEITIFRDNLKKDSIQRLEDGVIVTRKLNELNKYKEHFNNIKAEVANKIQNKEIKSDQSALINNLLKCVVLKLNEIDTIIQKRLQNLNASVPPLNLESSSAQNLENIFDHNTETKMSENFDFKTAAILLPKTFDSMWKTRQIGSKTLTFEMIEEKKILRIEEMCGNEVYLGWESMSEVWSLESVLRYRLSYSSGSNFKHLIRAVAEMLGDVKINIYNIINRLSEKSNVCCMSEVLLFMPEKAQFDVQLERRIQEQGQKRVKKQ